MKRIFLDTNIFADLVGERTQFKSGIEELISMEDFPTLYISALSIPITLYSLKIKAETPEFYRFSEISSWLEILPLTGTLIRDALKCESPDYEDTLQYLTAIENNCDYLLTRDKKHFSKIAKLIPSKTEIIHNTSQIK